MDFSWEGGLFLGGYFSGGDFSWRGLFLEGNFPGGDFSWGEIFRGGNFSAGGNFPWVEFCHFLGGFHLGGDFSTFPTDDLHLNQEEDMDKGTKPLSTTIR